MADERTFGMRLAPHERRQIERLAEARRTTMKDAVLGAVRRQLADLAAQGASDEPFVPAGRLKGAEHLIGCFEGPTDLSTNPDHLEGFGG
jgi:hypothetical protein